MSTEAIKISAEIWETCVRKDTEKVNKEWERKRKSMKEAFTKDKEFIKKHREERIRTPRIVNNNVPSSETTASKNLTDQIPPSREKQDQRL